MPLLKDTLNSLSLLSYEPLELIFIDNVSTDGSWEEASAYAAKDKRFKVFKNKKYLSMGENWNIALSHCKGEIIKLLCADDIVHAEYFASFINIFLQNSNVVLLSTRSDIIDDVGLKVYTRKQELIVNLSLSKSIVLDACIRKGTNVIGEPSGLFFRSSAVRLAGIYNNNYKYAIDLEYSLRLLDFGNLWVSGYKGYDYRMHSSSATVDLLNESERELINILTSNTVNKPSLLILRLKIRYRNLCKIIFIKALRNKICKFLLNLIYS